MRQKVWLAGGMPELIISAVANMPLLFINPRTMPTRRQSSNSSETANSITQHCTGFHDSTSGFFSFLLMWSGTILFLQRNQDNKCLCCLSISPSQYIISRIWYWQGITARGIQISLESSWCMAFYQLFIIGGSYSCWASLIVIHVLIFARRNIENWSPSDHILILCGNFLCIFYSLNNILLLF